MNLFDTIKDACNTLNSVGIRMMEINIPKSCRKKLNKEFLENHSSVEGLDIENGGIIVTKISYNGNVIKIHWYND